MENFFSPKEIYIGDQSELIVKASNITIDKNIFDKTDFKNKIYETENFSILNIEIIKINSNEYISIKFKAWNVGTLSFPNLENFGIFTKLPDVNVESVLKNESELVLDENTSPILIPGTQLLILEISFGFIVFCVVLLLFCIKIFKNKKLKNKKKILKKFSKSIKKLFSKKNIDKNFLCIESEKLLRNFLFYFFENFQNVKILSLTYSEMLNLLEKDFYNQKIFLDLKKIFDLLEKFRFSNSSLEVRTLLSNMNNFIKTCFDFYINRGSHKEKK